MDPRLAPRPYLHPVRTLGGTVTTDVHPADHPHHMGVSLAIPDVDGVQYWGGMSYQHGSGYRWLDNEGSQILTGQRMLRDGVDEDLEWRRPDGSLQLRERRKLQVRFLSGVAYALSWRSALSGDAAWSLGSPATNGRLGAGYGGLFWRFPSWLDARVLVREGEGESAAHGSMSPWLAVTSEAAGVTVVLVQAEASMPWFVRISEYLGACPALAWRDRREIPARSSLPIGLDALVKDGPLGTHEEVEQLLGEAGIGGEPR